MSVAEPTFAREGALLDALCTHCGLPVPAGELQANAHAFCCSGCRTAYAVLHESGLEHYYDLSERRLLAVQPTGRAFEEFDHAAFQQLWVRTRADGQAETELYLEGVHCASCVWLVERTPLAVPGVASAELDMGRSLVHITWDASRTKLSAIARFLDTLGYRPHPFRGVRAEQVRRREDRDALVRIGVAGAIAANVMLAAIALYSGFLSGMEGQYQHYFRWVSMLITAPALIWPGRVFFRSALASLRARALHMDVPIAIALAAGFTRGAINTFAGQGPIYFDGVATLVFLLLVGRFLQARAQRAATDSAELLHALSPATARLIEGDVVREIPAEALLPGMDIEVRSGDSIAGDGVVLRGESAIDRSLLTGESRPERVSAGAQVYAGTVNRGATLAIRVQQSGETTRVGQILREVEAGAARRAPVVRAADRLAGVFVGVVLVLAVATYAVWARRAPAHALDNAIALLVVTCPCALALATPLAVTVAIGRAARRGVLVKGGDALEALSRGGTLVLDKTGTLTEGRVSLVEWEGGEAVKAAVLAIELHSPHPLAAGFAAAWPGVEPAQARDARTVTGSGLCGVVDGREVIVGAPAYVLAHAHDRHGIGARAHGRALTPVLVAIDGEVVARAAFGDAIRSDAAATLALLRACGWNLRILSGDTLEVVQDVGARLGFLVSECTGGASPEAKLAEIERLAARGPVVMVGDGVNDAAAIARATVGVGVKGGAEACISAADVFLSTPGLRPLAELVQGSERAMRVIRIGIATSIAYNLVGAVLAVTGVINPLIAAIMMPVSSLTVVLIAWRGRTFEGTSR